MAILISQNEHDAYYVDFAKRKIYQLEIAHLMNPLTGESYDMNAIMLHVAKYAESVNGSTDCNELEYFDSKLIDYMYGETTSIKKIIEFLQEQQKHLHKSYPIKF